MHVRELRVRYRLRRIRIKSVHEGQLSSPSAVAAMFLDVLGREVVEVCGLFCLSTKLEILSYHELSRGTTHYTVVHPRDVFRTALLGHAAAVIIGHNHPSGDLRPSPEDRELTERLRAAGELMGVRLADHVIVGADGRFFSFQAAGSL